MPKTLAKYFFLFVLSSCFFSSCKKDSENPNADEYVASPQKLMNMLGKNWSEVEPNISDKKGYLYFDLTQDMNTTLKAAISLPAIEENNQSVNYSMLLNTQRQSDKVVTIDMVTVDSLSNMNKSQAYALMLMYYNDGLKTYTDTTYTFGSYQEPGGTVITTSLEEAVAKLNAGYETNRLSILYTTKKDSFSIFVAKNPDTGNYIFSYTSLTK